MLQYGNSNKYRTWCKIVVPMKCLKDGYNHFAPRFIVKGKQYYILICCSSKWGWDILVC